MVPKSLVLQILSGLSAVAVGVTATYFLFRSTSDVVSNLALKSTDGWTVETAPEKVDENNKNVEINVKWKKGDKTWASKIKGFIDNYDSGNSLDISSQKDELKKAIGIKDGNKRDKNIQQNLKTFISNSQKHKIKSTNTSFESIIDLGTLKAENKKYQFNNEEFKKLYDGTEEIVKKLGIAESKLGAEQELKETDIKNIKFEGKSNLEIEGDDKSLKLKIESTEDSTNFPEGLKFTFTATKETKLKQGDKDANPIVLKENVGTEFKIKINGESYSLEEKK